MIPARILSTELLTPSIKLVRVELAQKVDRAWFRPGQWCDFEVVEDNDKTGKGNTTLPRMGGYSFASSPVNLPNLDLVIQQERNLQMKEKAADETGEPAADGGHGAAEAAEKKSDDGKPRPPSMTSWIHSPACDVEQTPVKLQSGGDWIIQPTGAPTGGKQSARVLIAGGIGITPFLSFLRTYRKPPQLRKTHLLYSVRNPVEDAVYIKELQSLADMGMGLQLFETGLGKDPATERGFAADFAGSFTKQVKENVQVEQRRIQASDLDKNHIRDPDSQYYVCGPPEFAQDTVKLLVDEMKVDEGKVFYEKWW